MRLYLIRHGQTDYNSKRLIQGRVNTKLNEIGKKQAKLAGQKLKSLSVIPDALLSSPLSRALETAYLVSKKINFKQNILIEPFLIERDFGNYDLKSIAEYFPKVMVDGFCEDFFEDNEKIKLRITNGLNELFKKFENKSVVAASHAHSIRTFYLLFDDKKYSYTNFLLLNGSIHVFDYDGKNLKLIDTYLNEE